MPVCKRENRGEGGLICSLLFSSLLFSSAPGSQDVTSHPVLFQLVTFSARNPPKVTIGRCTRQQGTLPISVRLNVAKKAALHFQWTFNFRDKFRNDSIRLKSLKTVDPVFPQYGITPTQRLWHRGSGLTYWMGGCSIECGVSHLIKNGPSSPICQYMRSSILIHIARLIPCKPILS